MHASKTCLEMLYERTAYVELNNMKLPKGREALLAGIGWEHSPDIIKALLGALFETHWNLANIQIKVLNIAQRRCSRV